MDFTIVRELLPVIVALVGLVLTWRGISKQVGLQLRAQNQQELFIAALRDGAEFVCAANILVNDFHALAFPQHSIRPSFERASPPQQEALPPLYVRIREIMEPYNKRGLLLPPELSDVKEAVDAAFSDVAAALNDAAFQTAAADAAVVGGSSVGEALGQAQARIRDFRRAFDAWKQVHWSDMTQHTAGVPGSLSAPHQTPARSFRKTF